MNAERRPLTATFAHSPTADPDAVREFITQEKRSTDVKFQSASSDDALHRMPLAPNYEPTITKRRAKTTGVAPIGLIPVTVRLRPDVAGALKRASLERQLTGHDIFAQQDLVAQVLEPWLRQEGYL